MGARFEVDDRLARRAAVGDPAALEALVMTWLEPSLRLAQWMCRAAPEDAAQAALAELSRVARAGYFLGRPVPGADARQIARRAILRVCEQQGERWSGAEAFREPADTATVDPYRSRLRQDVDAVIRQLPPDLAETLRLMLAGWKPAEIAEELGISSDTVRSRRASIKQRIGAQLAELLEGEVDVHRS